MALPVGFTDLATAYQSPDNAFLNIIGVVVDFMAPKLSRGSSFVCTFKILDEPLSRSVHSSKGLMVRFFRDSLDGMPKVRNLGDIVLLRNIRMDTFSGQRLALSNNRTSTIVFPGNSIPSRAFSIAYKTDNQRIERLGVPQDINNFNLSEQDYIIHLKQAMSSQVELVSMAASSRGRGEPDASAPPPSKRQKTSGGFDAKFKLIADLEQRMFADICGVVVKRIGASYGCDLYITDFTENKLMRYYPAPEEENEQERDGDIFGYNGPPKRAWKGPWGFLVLKVNLKPPHAQYANSKINEDDVVLLKNVKTRITPEGAWLEGDMWPDDMDSENIKIRKMTNLSIPEIQAMMQRKDKYWAKRKARLAPPEVAEPKLSRKQRKKLRKQKKKQAQAASGAASDAESDSITLELKPKPKTNPNIRCSNQEVAMTRIKDILDPENVRHTNETPDGTSYVLPFINARYRARVRVIDYEPKALEDFAAQPEGERSSDPTDWQFHSPKCEWHFALLLEDATKPTTKAKAEHHQIWVQVHHDQAQFLFGNDIDDPDDLRHDPQLLARLREKIFHLWGNLEETGGGESLSNSPFECCIEEYGVEVDGAESRNTALGRWQRMHSMFGATIL